MTSRQRRQLLASIHSFLAWLRGKQVEVKHPNDIKISFPPPLDEDWLMRVEPGMVTFNSHILMKVDFDFYELIVLHEAVHAFVHGLPNKEDVQQLKDDFQAQMMNFVDIEADFYVAQFYKERRGSTIIDLLRLYHNGNRVFVDNKTRVPKLERFIGSMLSIVNLFLMHPSDEPSDRCDLYLPKLGTAVSDDTLHFVLATKQNFAWRTSPIERGDLLRNLHTCYKSPATYSLAGYAECILQFMCKALGKNFPVHFERQLRFLS